MLIFGRNASFSALLSEIDLAAETPYPILLLGETGVGKELVARRIHETSPRKKFPFIPVNCGAISPNLFESELFGHERGAFSGAMQTVKGLARLAHKGTLFLDELGELELDLQVKLLRFLDSGEVRSVGGHRFEKTDVRVIAATNCDLVSEVSQGAFRQDLWERLSVFAFRIPALRERREDIEAICRQQLERLQAVAEPPVFELLASFDWPGNVRQLRNVLIKASLFGRSKITPYVVRKILDQEAQNSFSPLNSPGLSKLPLADIEREVILERLKRCRGNRKKTAKELGIAKSTLHEKLRRWKADGAIRLVAPHGASDGGE